MTKNMNQKLAAGRNERKPVSQSLARKLMGRTTVGAVATAMILPMASLAMLATTSVPTYAQAAGNCLTANDEATIRAMQALIDSINAELPTLRDQLAQAQADANDIQAQIDALNQRLANGDPPPGDLADQVNALNNKLVDALQRVGQINGQISRDLADLARAEGVIKALSAKERCVPPVVSDNRPPVVPGTAVAAVPGTQWPQLVEWIHFNDDGTETWHWKDGRETVRTRTGVVSPPAVDRHVVLPPRTVELPRTKVDLPHPTVTPEPRPQTVTVTHTTPLQTTHRTIAMTAPPVRPGLLAPGHAPATIAHAMPASSMAHTSFARVAPIAPMHVGSPVATPRIGMPQMGGFAKIR